MSHPTSPADGKPVRGVGLLQVRQLEAVPRPDDVPVMPEKVGLSDKVRMILLLEYGGLWVDADTVFLRDLSPFWPYEWAERWSMHVAHNTAMLRLFAGSRIGHALWERAFALNDTSFYPMKLVTLLKGTGQQLPALPSPGHGPALSGPRGHHTGSPTSASPLSLRTASLLIRLPSCTKASLPARTAT